MGHGYGEKEEFELGRGLTPEEATERLRLYGANKLPEEKPDGLLAVWLRQFQSPLIYLLFAAAAIVLAMGEVVDGAVIFVVLFFNAVVGTIQEGKAQRTLFALKRFVETKATVRRDGEYMIVPDSEVVPGDILILQEGERVPADARVVATANLTIDEAVLTGESVPVHKTTDVLIGENLSPAEQKNMVFKGTYVSSGHGEAVVMATGMNTEIGKISKALAAPAAEIPLQKDIRLLSRFIILFVVCLSAVLFLLGSFLGIPARDMFATVVSLAVSVIPEGLPVVVTLVLATGVWRMSKRHVLVKKLQAVEALGQARVIAVDKTGTLTKNEMVVQRAYIGGKIFEIDGVGYEPKGEIRLQGSAVDAANHPELLLAGKMSAFCSNARVQFLESEHLWRVAGDPTEAAMLVFAEKAGFHKEELERESPRVFEIPFDYRLKFHASAHRLDGGRFLSVVGAPETVLDLSHISEDAKRALERVILSFLHDGLRVVALAKMDNAPETLLADGVRNLTFVGFLGMKDALRPEAARAVELAKSAGIRVVMITGDHVVTARAIATEAGIYREGDMILTGPDVDALSDEELSEKLGQTSVFARVTPEHKLRIIRAYKMRGEIIAMTGDGVNDVPSLVAADLGVAMGKIGTEVTKEAADLVLLDDNFGSIVSAVEEGRSIYKTIKKVILYLFSTSFGEVLTITGALLIGLPLPLLPAQIIWLNFVTDGFLDVALAMEPKEGGLLRSSFDRPKKYLVDKLMARRMVFMAVPMMIGTLALFSAYVDVNLAKAWTVSLTTLAVFQWFNAWNCRHESASLFRINPLANPFLVGATGIVIGLQLLVVYHPMLQKILHTAPLALSEWLMIISVAASIVLIEEARKLFARFDTVQVVR